MLKMAERRKIRKISIILMGENDLALIVDFPGIQQAMKGSIELTKQTGISFSTAPALTVEEFDKLFK